MSANEDNLVTLEQAMELHRRGNLQGAGDAYAALLQLNPKYHDARYGLGTVRMQQGEFEAAQQLLQQAVTEAPAVPEYRFNLGFTLQRLERHFEAIEQFRAALAQRPEARTILIALAQSFARTRNYPAALQAHERALALGTPGAADYLAYADLLFAAKRPDEARQALKNARQLGSRDARGLFLEARCERLAGNHDVERELLRQAIDIRPGYGDAWEYLVELTADDDLLALADDCEAIGMDAATPSADKVRLGYTVGRAYERMGDYAYAFKSFAAANDRQARDAAARGKAYRREENDNFLAWARREFDGRGVSSTATPAVEQPLFIVGMPRSGTTLVESILGGLDGVVVGGESEALEWVATQYYNALATGRSAAIRDLEQKHWDELRAHYWQIQTGDRCRLTDKMPTNFRHVGLIARMFPAAPVIWVRRDPRDVAVSIYSRLFPDGHAYATALEDIAHYCGFAVALLAHWQTLHPDRIHVVELERLIADPEQESRRLAGFCGLEWRASCLDVHERPHASYTFSETQVRQPINAGGVGRWKNYADFLAPFIAACAANGVELKDS